MKNDIGRPAWAEECLLDPLPLARELDPATPFPVDALGAVGAAVVEQMHEVIQAPQALIGQSILAAMNQVAQPFANVIIDERVSPLSDFFLTLGESGERKSAVDAWALAQVRERQRALMAKYRTERDEFEPTYRCQQDRSLDWQVAATGRRTGAAHRQRNPGRQPVDSGRRRGFRDA